MEFHRWASIENLEFELEKEKWKAQQAALERGMNSGTVERWVIQLDDEEISIDG